MKNRCLTDMPSKDKMTDNQLTNVKSRGYQ